MRCRWCRPEVSILPLSLVVGSLQVRPDLIRTIGGSGRVVEVRDEYMPVLDLEALFGVPRTDMRNANSIMVVVESEGGRVALLVDELIGQHQVVVKNLEANYRKVDDVSGATIMGERPRRADPRHREPRAPLSSLMTTDPGNNMNLNGLMRRFTIRARMIGAIGIVLGLLGIVGGAGIFGLMRVQALGDQFTAVTFADSHQLAELARCSAACAATRRTW